jgi:hypothetical protein
MWHLIAKASHLINLELFFFREILCHKFSWCDMYSDVDVMSTLLFYLIKYYKGCTLVKVTCIKKNSSLDDSWFLYINGQTQKL